MTFRTLGIVIGAAILLADSQPVAAQGLGYGIAGAGARTGWFGGGVAFHAAGGGELVFNGRAGVGGEVGLFGSSGSALSVASFNGVVRLSDPGDRTSPYLTGGYSRFSSGEGAFHAWNAGIGADFWASDHAGARVEFRDHVRPDSRGTVHYFSIRAGIAFK